MTNPTVNLTFERVLCPRHGEPYRVTWPSGYPVFSLLAFEEILKLPSVQQGCAGDVKAIESLLDETPICCRLPGKRLLGKPTKRATNSHGFSRCAEPARSEGSAAPTGPGTHSRESSTTAPTSALGAWSSRHAAART